MFTYSCLFTFLVFVYIFRCLFTFSAVCLQFQLFVDILGCFWTFSAVYWHSQLFDDTFSCLLTISAVYLYFKLLVYIFESFPRVCLPFFGSYKPSFRLLFTMDLGSFYYLTPFIPLKDPLQNIICMHHLKGEMDNSLNERSNNRCKI